MDEEVVIIDGKKYLRQRAISDEKSKEQIQQEIASHERAIVELKRQLNLVK